MNTSTAPDRIQEFLAEVAAHFDDLAESDRRELIDDLEQHLLELAADDEAGLEAELASPAAYATELRQSAGLPVRRPRPDSDRSRARRELDRVRARGRRLAATPPVAAIIDFLPQLRPAWWVLRAWAVLVVIAMVFDGGPWYRHVPVPGRSLLGLLALGAAIVVSVKAGQDRTDESWPWRVGNASAVIATLIVLGSAASAEPTVEYVESVHEEWQPPVLRHPDGEPITNLYLYDLDGNPVTDVLVHDGLGRPVEIGDLLEAGIEDIETVYARDRFGAPVRHLYPLEQYIVAEEDAGQGTERHPRPAPFPVLEATERPSPNAVAPEPAATSPAPADDSKDDPDTGEGSEAQPTPTASATPETG